MKEYIKLYQKMREDYYKKWGAYSHPLSLAEFEKLNQNIFKEHLEEKENTSNRILATKLYINLILEKIKYFAYYIAFSEDDFSKLNDALWQNGRTALLCGGINHSGTLYTANIVNGLINCFACNDDDVVKSFVPEALPLLKGTFYTNNVINLLSSLYYKNDEKLQEAITIAEKFLSKKKLSGIAENYVHFFIFLAKKDAESLSACLQKICEAYQKQGYPIEKIDKCFAPEVHGFYRLIRFFDESLFEEVKMPEHKCFIKEFEEWQKENNFPKGRQFYRYQETLDNANLILQSPIPVIHLCKVDGTLMMDVEKFAGELSASVVK